MSKHFFDFNDGDMGFAISDQMAIDTDGDLMMRMSDNMALDLESGEMHWISSWSSDDDD